MRRTLNFLNKIFNNEPVVHYINVAHLLKDNPGYLPKNVKIHFSSLTERIKSIPYQSLSDDLLWDIWDKTLNEMNRRKANRGVKNVK